MKIDFLCIYLHIVTFEYIFNVHSCCFQLRMFDYFLVLGFHKMTLKQETY